MEKYTEILLDKHLSKFDKSCIYYIPAERKIEYIKQSMHKDIHNIHNYIRDYTKISNEDKPFLIACILIALKKESFRAQIANYDSKLFIYDLIKQALYDYNIDISPFEQFRTNEDTNTHFLKLITLIADIYDKNPSVDMLNHFYSEFVKYNNTDGKALGIVLTPPYIVKLIVDMLGLTKEDVFLDICAGTGSFPLCAYAKGCKSIVACEYQNKLFALLKCNVLLRDMVDNAELHKGDCFNLKITRRANKSAINPPYGTKGHKELDFVLKQLELIEDGGIAAAIIPITSINNTKFVSLKRKILKIATPTHIINLNKTTFYPYAAIQCAIIRFEKRPYKDSLVKFINYEDDGYEIMKHRGRVKTDEYKKIKERLYKMIFDSLEDARFVLNTKITAEEDWNFYNYFNGIDFTLYEDEDREKDIDIEIALRNIYEEPLERVRLFANGFEKKLFKIIDIFDITTIARTTLTYARNNPGKIPYISASAKNSGITAYTNKITNEKYCLTVANSGSVCATFYHPYDICATDSVYVLRLKKQYDKYKTNRVIMRRLALLIEKNKVKYSFGRACRLNKICNDYIELPVRVRGDSYAIAWDILES